MMLRKNDREPLAILQVVLTGVNRESLRNYLEEGHGQRVRALLKQMIIMRDIEMVGKVLAQARH